MDLLDPTWTEIPEGNKRAELYPYSAPQFNFLLNEFTPKAINSPRTSIIGVTVNVKVKVKNKAL